MLFLWHSLGTMPPEAGAFGQKCRCEVLCLWYGSLNNRGKRHERSKAMRLPMSNTKEN